MYSDPAIDSRPALCYRIQRNTWSSVVHVIRQFTDLVEFQVFLREQVDYGS